MDGEFPLMENSHIFRPLIQSLASQRENWISQTKELSVTELFPGCIFHLL